MNKCRYWQVIFYQGIPDDFLLLLDDLNIDYIVSPLHNDKPFYRLHFHVLFDFHNYESFGRISDFLKTFDFNISYPVQIDVKSWLFYALPLGSSPYRFSSGFSYLF